MENFKWFEKWYSKHVIEHHNEKISFNIENNIKDHSWKFKVDFEQTDYKHLKLMDESKKVSDYNHYKINAQGRNFISEGDFTKLDFLMGKFRTYIGETDLQFYGTDFFLNPDIQNFIFEQEKDANIFLHYTTEKEVLDKILESGFEFLTFEKTTVNMINEPININYNHMLRKPFGNFALIICISKDIYKKYGSLINKSTRKDIKVEEVLSQKPPYKIDFQENVYTLHRNFIKGYINYTTGEIFKNPKFDMTFDDNSFVNYL